MPALADYLAHITPQHANVPKFVATVTAFVQPLVDAQALLTQLLTAFDIDTAVGVQLDAVGQWVGRSRQVAQPISGVYFAFDTQGVGWDQGHWKGPFDPDTGLVALGDDEYRLLLRAKIILNHWDGTIGVAANAVAELFGTSPNTIISIQDNQDMSMTVGISGQVPSSVLLALLDNGELPMSPSGVGISYLVTSVNGAPLFGWDTEDATVSGWDVGAWGGTAGLNVVQVPGPVFSFARTSTTSSSVGFSWVAPTVGAGPYTYQLQYGLSPASVWILSGRPTNSLTGTVNGLAPGTAYDFQVYPINAGGAGTPSQTITVTTSGGAPGPVTGLVATGSTATSISLSWNIVLGAGVSYVVQYRITGSGSFTPLPPVTTPSITVTGLVGNTGYDFQVASQNSFGSGASSGIITAGTSGSAPGLVQNLAAGTPGTTDIPLTWSQPLTNNGAYTYTVEFAQNIAPITFSVFNGPVTVTGLGGSADVTGLVSGVPYLLQVYASNLSGNGIPCLPISATTLSPAPAQVQNLAATSETDTTVSLSWSAVAGAANYQVQYQLTGATQYTLGPAASPSTSATVTGLNPGTSYNFQVYAIASSNLNGPVSVPTTISTAGDVPGQVGSLALSNLTATAVTLSWTAATGRTGVPVYQMQWRPSGTLPWNLFGAPISALTGTITNLQPQIAYDFSVVASNGFGAGPISAIDSATTLVLSSTTTFNPFDLASGVTLTNNNLVATTQSGPGAYGVRSTTTNISGKRHLEFGLTVLTPTLAVGIANATFAFQAGVGNDTNGLGIEPGLAPQVAEINNVSFTRVAQADSNGATATFEIDFSGNKWWFTTNRMRALLGPSAWNNNTTANPGTGIGGFDMTTLGTQISQNVFITAAGQTFADSNNNTWGLQTSGATLIATENGTAAGVSTNVQQLAYINGVVWYQNTTGNWFSWDGSASWIPAPNNIPPIVESPNNTLIQIPGERIYDQSGNAWTLATVAGSGLVVKENGVNAGTSANVLNLEYINHVIWAYFSNQWQSWNGTTWVVGIPPKPTSNSGGPWFAAMTEQTGGAVTSINTGGSTFVVPISSGFTSWDGTGGTQLQPPAQITGISPGAVTATSISLSWAAPPLQGSSINYQVQYQIAGSTTWYNGPDVTAPNGTVINLVPATTYNVQVYAYNAAGTGVTSAALTISTLAPPAAPLLTYRGINAVGADLTNIAALAPAFPHANSIVIPMFISTASQTSADVTLTVTTAQLATWVQAANTAGFQVFIGVYLSCRDGTAPTTITPGPSLSAVATFFSNLQTVLQQIATVGSANKAIGMWCVGFQPWAGFASGDTGPFSALHMAQWQSTYNACKAIWPSGIISFAAYCNTLPLMAPTSDATLSWSFWDALVFLVWPGSNNTFTTATQFEAYFTNNTDPVASIAAATGPIPLFSALVQYSNQTGRQIIIADSSIVPADGNQVDPSIRGATPPPFDYPMQAAWFQAVVTLVADNINNFAGFFARDAATSLFNSPNLGIAYRGIQGQAAGATVDAAFAALNGTQTGLGAPGNLTV